MNLFDQMLLPYEVLSQEDQNNAIHEVMQQIALAGLFRGGFFNKAAFYGGTSLRVFYGLERFSEDLDFSLLESNKNFELENYFDPIIDEFKACGRDILISKKEKRNPSNIESAFLKDDSAIYNLEFRTEKQIKIKIEVDKNPPLGFFTDYKLLMLPFSFMVRTYSLPDLYAGKMHAILFRTWKNRVKGRDWYDFEWFVRNNYTLNFNHLLKRINQLTPLKTEELTIDSFKLFLKDKISKTNFDLAKKDVQPFIKNPEVLAIWSIEYFNQIVDLMQFKK
ncbi:nucleotidyl transferase AbiEii/AbiGii toxin family protein [Candidatus Parcubacteria bacterium]|nr:nucleotidyl transferase AbiEii/AbiGii toxin family protein [Candidatus Parcubacteria bacterium]